MLLRTESVPSSTIERVQANVDDYARTFCPLTDRKRYQVWGAALILGELEDLGLRIELSSR